MTHAYEVIQPFRATEPISGAGRIFEPGELVVCDPKPAGDAVTIELGSSLFVVERSTFVASSVL